MNQTTIDGRYTISRPLGSGGMAEVFLAHDKVLDRDVALKILRGQYAHDGEFAERFRREARSAAALSHPNIVQVYDRGEAPDGTNYIAMEYVSGGTLKGRLDERGPLEPMTALAVAAQIADALHAAHGRGVIHRDVKPQNVLVTDMGHLKVTDFGIARAASSVTISATNAVFGTAGYLSPEQALGNAATPRSDLYSLGIVLYEMLTGVVPYRADNPVAVCMKHVTEPLRPPAGIDPAIPGNVNALVVKLLAKDPAERPQSASELLDDIGRIRDGALPTPKASPIRPRSAVTRATGVQSPAARRDPAASPQPRRGAPPGLFSRRRVVLAACALALLALLGAASLALSGGTGDGSPVARALGVSGGDPGAPPVGPGGDGAGDPGTAGPGPTTPLDPPAPPAASPPASPPAASPPPGGGPGQSQYAGES